MNRRLVTGLGIAEVGALALLWRSVKAAPLRTPERDTESDGNRAHDGSSVDKAAQAV